MKRSSLLLLLLAALLPGPVSSDVRSLLQKEGLAVLYEDPLKGLAEESARIYPEIARELEAGLGLSVPPSPTIVLVKDHDAFRRMAAEGPVIAFAVPARNLIVVDCSRGDRNPFAMEETLKHELTHLMIHHAVDGREIPRWLDEGLAQWASGGVGELLRNRKGVFLEEAVLSGRWIPIRVLSDRFPRNREAILLAYEESEDFVDSLIRRFGMAGIRRVLERLKTGEQWENAVAEGLGVPFDELEKAWHDRLQRRKSWFPVLSRYLYEILFFVAAVASAYGFLRAYRRKRAYLREEETDESDG